MCDEKVILKWQSLKQQGLIFSQIINININFVTLKILNQKPTHFKYSNMNKMKHVTY